MVVVLCGPLLTDGLSRLYFYVHACIHAYINIQAIIREYSFKYTLLVRKKKQTDHN